MKPSRRAAASQAARIRRPRPRRVQSSRTNIASIATLGWVDNLVGFYAARELVGFDAFQHVVAWLDRGMARAAVQRGMKIPSRMPSTSA